MDNLITKNWSKRQIASFYSCLPFTLKTWKKINLISIEVESLYWKKVKVKPYQSDKALEYAIEKLITHGRPCASVECISQAIFDQESLDTKLIVKALLTVTEVSESTCKIDSYQLVEIIKVLQNRKDILDTDLFSIEWTYLSFLNDNNDASPQYLEKLLASTPSFFCEVIGKIYRSDKVQNSQNESTEQEKSVALKCYQLLDNWHIPPGKQLDDSFDEIHFENWLKEILKICKETGHLDVALNHIGQVLINAPQDPSGLWINNKVAEVLNRKESEKMRNGFRTAIYNSRGVHWVDPSGKQERELAENYKQRANEIENAGFQRLATTLRNLAESYDKQAERVVEDHAKDKDDNGI